MWLRIISFRRTSKLEINYIDFGISNIGFGIRPYFHQVINKDVNVWSLNIRLILLSIAIAKIKWRSSFVDVFWKTIAQEKSSKFPGALVIKLQALTCNLPKKNSFMFPSWELCETFGKNYSAGNLQRAASDKRITKQLLKRGIFNSIAKHNNMMSRF